MKREKGITLIALVVTIVVLLILAAVSISMLTGENGIINQAKKSKDATEQARVQELVDLAVGSLVARYQGDTSQITPQMVADEINSTENRSDVYTDDETFPATIKFPEEGREAIADLNSSESTGGSDEIYSAEVTEDMIAPVNIFDYEIINNAEIGATQWENLPTKEERITRIKPEYANLGGYNPDNTGTIKDTNYKIILDDGTTISETLVIPYQVDGQYVEGGETGEMYRITEVSAGVYWNRFACGYILPNVETIIYPNTVKVIDGNDFILGNDEGKDRRTPKKIILSQNLEVIGDNAFVGCYELTDIVIPKTVTSIGDSAFYRCTNLTNITIPENVTSIGNLAFDSTKWKANLPKGEIYLGKVFYKYVGEMPEGTSIAIKDGTKSIAGYAFSDGAYGDACSGLINITIPESVTSIGECAFCKCTNLTNITIPESVTSIGNSAFKDCSSLTNITIPDSVTGIGNSAFYDCSSLTNITIPESVTSIGASAFEWCSSLTNITIPDSVTSMGESVFAYWTSSQTINVPFREGEKPTGWDEDWKEYCEATINYLK